MGAGGSLEAAYSLSGTGPIKAGTWAIVGDGLIFASCDVTFAVLWRTTSGDTTVATFTHHFDPGPAVGDAVLYDDTAAGTAVTPGSGDQLVLHLSVEGSPDQSTLYGLNGDGPVTGGRQPFLTLPPQ